MATLYEHLTRSGGGEDWPTTPVRVALVITDLDVGGAEKALVALARGLDRSRWHPVVICLAGEGPLAGLLRESGIEVGVLGVAKSRPIQAVRRLAAALRDARPALVQSFLFHANVASRVAARLAKVPHVIGGIRVAEREKTWHLAVERMSQHLGCGWVCVSEHVREFSERVGRLDPRRLVVIPNGIDVVAIDTASATSRESLGLSADDFVVVFAGRLDVQKGVDTLLDAIERLGRSAAPLRLLMAGDGPLREMVLSRLRNPILAERVRWLGHRGDIPGLLLASDALVLPSRWEGMPNVVLEAMAAGKPVIATNVDGTCDIPFGGWRIAPESPDALAHALSDAARDRSAARVLGLRNRAVVEQSFAQSAVVAKYEGLWGAVLGLLGPA